MQIGFPVLFVHTGSVNTLIHLCILSCLFDRNTNPIGKVQVLEENIDEQFQLTFSEDLNIPNDSEDLAEVQQHEVLLRDPIVRKFISEEPR